MRAAAIAVLLLASPALADKTFRRADWGYEVSVPDDHVLRVEDQTVVVETPAKQHISITTASQDQQQQEIARLGKMAAAKTVALEDLGADKVDGFDRHRYRLNGRLEYRMLARDKKRFTVALDVGAGKPDAMANVKLRPITGTATAKGTEPLIPLGGWLYASDAALLTMPEHQVWRSRDGGWSWEATDLSVEQANAVNVVVVGAEALLAYADLPEDPDAEMKGTHVRWISSGGLLDAYEDPNTIDFALAGDGFRAAGYVTREHTVTATTDGGRTWKSLPLPKQLAKIRSAELHLEVGGGAWFVSTKKATYRTTDGAAWTKVYPGLIQSLAMGADLYAAVDAKLLRSTDRGVTWKLAATAKDPLAKVVVFGEHVYAFGWKGATLLELVNGKLVPASGFALPKVMNVWSTKSALVVNVNETLVRFLP